MGYLTRNFKRSEFTCHCGCGADDIKQVLVDKLQVMRNATGVPIKINSGVRCKTHNKEIGSSDTSSHLTGDAVDVQAEGDAQRADILLSAVHAGFSRIGLRKDFIHLDIDGGKNSPRVWLYPQKQ